MSFPYPYLNLKGCPASAVPGGDGLQVAEDQRTDRVHQNPGHQKHTQVQVHAPIDQLKGHGRSLCRLKDKKHKHEKAGSRKAADEPPFTGSFDFPAPLRSGSRLGDGWFAARSENSSPDAPRGAIQSRG